MNLPKLLQRTAARFEQATQSVLATWSPDCGCLYPGSLPRCKTCPCSSEFEQRVQAKIHACSIETPCQPDSRCIYETAPKPERPLSQPQVWFWWLRLYPCFRWKRCCQRHLEPWAGMALLHIRWVLPTCCLVGWDGVRACLPWLSEEMGSSVGLSALWLFSWASDLNRPSTKMPYLYPQIRRLTNFFN